MGPNSNFCCFSNSRSTLTAGVTDIQIDRQTDRQTDIQIDRQTYIQIDMQKDIQTDGQTGIIKGLWAF